MADELHLLSDHLKAGVVADAVDQDHTVGPLELLVADGFGRFAALEEIEFRLSKYIKI